MAHLFFDCPFNLLSKYGVCPGSGLWAQIHNEFSTSTSAETIIYRHLVEPMETLEPKGMGGRD